MQNAGLIWASNTRKGKFKGTLSLRFCLTFDHDFAHTRNAEEQQVTVR